MSQAVASPSRRRTRRRSKSSSVASARPCWELNSRYLATLTSAIDVALCRLQYYLNRIVEYQAQLAAHHPFHVFKINCIAASFRVDMVNYWVALRNDISRIGGAQAAMKAALRVDGGQGQGAADALPRAARSAPVLRQLTASLSGARQPVARDAPAWRFSSSSDSDNAQDKSSGTPLCRQRRGGRQSDNVRERHKQRSSNTTTKTGAQSKQSSVSSGACHTDEQSLSGAYGRIVEEAEPLSGNGQHQGRPSGGNGGEASQSVDTLTEHTTKACLSANKTDRSKTNTQSSITIDKDNGTAQLSTSTSSVALKFKVQTMGHVYEKDGRDTSTVCGKTCSGVNSSLSPSMSNLNSGRSGAEIGDENWIAKGNQNNGGARSGSMILAPSGSTTDGSSARDVLCELHRQYGLLCGLLKSHLQRLQLRTSAAELQRAKDEQQAAQVLRQNAGLRRALAAAGAELLRGRARLGERAQQVRAFCEAARRLSTFRPPRPPRPRRRRRPAVTAAMLTSTPPPIQPRHRTASGISAESLLSMCLCWSRTASD